MCLKLAAVKLKQILVGDSVPSYCTANIICYNASAIELREYFHVLAKQGHNFSKFGRRYISRQQSPTWNVHLDPIPNEIYGTNTSTLHA